MKKLFSTLLVTILCFTITNTAFAADNLSEDSVPHIKIVNLSNRISERSIQNITSQVGAAIIYADGTIMPIDTVVTIEDAPSESSSLLKSSPYHLIGNSYLVTVAADTSKYVSDSGDKNTPITTASATLQMKWLDVSGINNRIEKVSGTLTVDRGTVTSGIVRYGNGQVSAINWVEKDVGSAPSFSYSPDMLAFDPTADYAIHFKDELFQLHLKVTSSILQ